MDSFVRARSEGTTMGVSDTERLNTLNMMVVSDICWCDGSETGDDRTIRDCDGVAFRGTVFSGVEDVKHPLLVSVNPDDIRSPLPWVEYDDATVLLA